MGPKEEGISLPPGYKVDLSHWQKIPVLNDGFVHLLDVLGSDADICWAARQGSGSDKKSPEDDRRLIRYFFAHREMSPLEQAIVKLHVRLPRDTLRQWIRYRTARVQEHSTRYREAIDSYLVTEPDQWRAQAKSNKQGSSGMVTNWPAEYTRGPIKDYTGDAPKTIECIVDLDGEFVTVADCSPGEYLSAREAWLHKVAREIYEERLAMGVAKEQAHKDLPMCHYTEMVWNIDLRNLFHLLEERMDSHAQLEFREYANAIGSQIVAKLFPFCWEAFQDYVVNAMTLSAGEIALVRAMAHAQPLTPLFKSLGWGEDKCRERDEALAKARKILYGDNS